MILTSRISRDWIEYQRLQKLCVWKINNPEAQVVVASETQRPISLIACRIIVTLKCYLCWIFRYSDDTQRPTSLIAYRIIVPQQLHQIISPQTYLTQMEPVHHESAGILNVSIFPKNPSRMRLVGFSKSRRYSTYSLLSTNLKAQAIFFFSIIPNG